MRSKQSNPQAVKKSHWHSFLYFSSAFIGMSCGRCVAELVMVATNYAAGNEYFSEEDHATQGWMLVVAGSLGLVAGLAFAHSHSQAHEMHAGNLLLNGLKAGKLKLTERETFYFRDNATVYGEVLPLARKCSSQFELLSGGFDKQPVLDRLRVFKRDLQVAYQASKDGDMESQSCSFSNELVAGLAQLSAALQQVIDSSFESAPLIEPGLMKRFARVLCCLGVNSTNVSVARTQTLTASLLGVRIKGEGAGVEDGVELCARSKSPRYQPPAEVGGQGVGSRDDDYLAGPLGGIA
ncbi:MAG: hypothetical protein P1U40_13485 [Coxiellaceae bacterium]|nr:hypothetical protein [Coxiellaceae bacterium]